MSWRWFRRTILQVVAAVFLLAVGACRNDVSERAGIADTVTAPASASPEPEPTTTTTPTATTPTTQEAAGQLPPMQGLCTQFPVQQAVEVFDEAAIELTTGVEAEEACEIEVRDQDNRLLASFVLAIGDEAELIRGFLTQLAISDGSTIWLVRLQLDSPPMNTDTLAELGQILYDNQPEL